MKSPIMQHQYVWPLIFLSVSADIARIRLPNDIFSQGGSTRFMNWGREGGRGHSKQMRRCLETRVCVVLLHLWVTTIYKHCRYTVLCHCYYPLFIPTWNALRSSPYILGNSAPLDSCLYYYLITVGHDALCVFRLYSFNSNPNKTFYKLIVS